MQTNADKREVTGNTYIRIKTNRNMDRHKHMQT